MPARGELVAVSPEKLAKQPGFTRVQKHSVLFPKRAVSTAEFKKRQTRILSTPPKVKEVQPAPKRIKAVRVTAIELGKLRAVHESSAATAELVTQKLSPEQAIGSTYSALVALEYTKLKAERKARLAKAKDPKKVEAEWQQVVEGVRRGFAAGGLRGLTESDLDRFSAELTRSKANFNAVVEIANSATVVGSFVADGSKAAVGNFVTVYDFVKDLGQIVIPTPLDFCDRAIEGKYTKHFSRSFNLTVSLFLPCPTWRHPFRWCWKTFTLAGVSFSVNLEVGYRITCCGATAYGSASVQACVSILGKSACATCTAKVIGLAGIAKSGSGSSCSYGLSVTAELKCTAGGITMFYASVPYGWSVTGPCPPAVLPCSQVG